MEKSFPQSESRSSFTFYVLERERFDLIPFGAKCACARAFMHGRDRRRERGRQRQRQRKSPASIQLGTFDKLLTDRQTDASISRQTEKMSLFYLIAATENCALEEFCSGAQHSPSKCARISVQ